ncbi:MAG: hypothetical protein H0T78_06525 [Longispora sp.]|nr:hypothetical protein [Longispora sp. (in: high G+C Gram-positive bacteria)]
MVSAAASICLHLRHLHYKLRLISDTGVDIQASEADGEDSLLNYLAEVQPGPRGDMGQLGESIRRRIDDGLVIAILGQLGPEETKMLSGLRRAGSTCVAFLLNRDTWVHATHGRHTAAGQTQESAALALLNAGWRVIGVEKGADLAALWPQAARRNQGFAFRAALAETISPTGYP